MLVIAIVLYVIVVCYVVTPGENNFKKCHRVLSSQWFNVVFLVSLLVSVSFQHLTVRNGGGGVVVVVVVVVVRLTTRLFSLFVWLLVVGYKVVRHDCV